MESLKKAFKEWNAVVEALGQGKQTMVIRKTKTSNRDFLLYPTFNYAIQDNFLDFFKNNQASFVKKYDFPKREKKLTEVKYYANVEKVIKMPLTSIIRIRWHYIWNSKHIRSYLDDEGFIWILRVFKLKKSHMVKNANGLTFANLSEKIPIAGSKPVLSDQEFKKELESILGKANIDD